MNIPKELRVVELSAAIAQVLADYIESCSIDVLLELGAMVLGENNTMITELTSLVYDEES